MFQGRKFTFSWEISLTFLALTSLCFAMGFWQYQRYRGKVDYFDKVAKQKARGPLALDPNQLDFEELEHATVFAKGHFDYEQEMVLVNRSKDQTGGVKVITPFRIEGSHKHVLVDRGFVPYAVFAEGKLEELRPQGIQEIRGQVHPSQDPQFFLTPEERVAEPGTLKKRWLRVDIPKMAAQLNYPILPVYLEQTNQGSSLPERIEHAVLSPSRHINYLLQWLGFGLFSLGIGLYIQYRPPRKAKAVRLVTPNRKNPQTA